MNTKLREFLYKPTSKTILKAYKYRIYPNKEQQVYFSKTFGCVRFVYNKMLAERKEIYEKYKDDKKELKKQKLPTPAKYKFEFDWLKEVDKWYPSSKICNNCGEINNDLKLSDREWQCDSCKSILDRDHNAAKNIRAEGVRILEILR